MEQLFGHTHLMASLADAVTHRRLSHAYLFEGAEGIGKKTAAAALAQRMMCETSDACGHCEGCRKVLAGSHPDVIVADDSFFASDKQKAGSVEAMRTVRSLAYTRPFMGQYKLFVLPQADQMLIPAQNSLLKILEEPPSYCVFVLICENANLLLETVRSRSVPVRFSPLNDEDMTAFLRSRYSAQTAELLLRPSLGIPGQAIRIAEDEEFLQRRAQAAELFCAFLNNGDPVPIASFFDARKDLWEELIDGLLELVGEAARISCGQPGGKQARILAEQVGVPRLTAIFDRLQQTARALRANAYFPLSVTKMLMDCRNLAKTS